MAMKARVANHIRKTLFKRTWEDIKTGERDQILKEIFDLNHKMHWELIAYKRKRAKKNKVEEIRRGNGYYITGKGAKKKTSKEEYKSLQETLASGRVLVKKAS